MRSNKFALGFGVSVLLATASVFAQSPAPCAAEFDRCSAQFPSEFRNVRRSNAPTGTCALGAVYSRDLCAGNFESAQVCAPTVNGNSVTISPGQSITVTCSGVAPRRPNRRRVSDRQLVHCDESLGAVASDENPNVCVCQPMPGFNAGAPVVVADHVVRERMAERYRVGPHAMETSYGCLYVANGQPRPADQLVLRILAAVIAAQELQAQQIRDLQQADVEQGRVNGRVNGRLNVVETAIAQRSTFRLQFDGALGGNVHWNAGSPVGALGGGFLLRPAVILRWSDSFGLRIFGGWGMGAQSNTPYRRMTPTGPVEQSAPLHQGTFGLDALIGGGSVSAIVGVGGFVAGRTAPAVVPGDVSGLLAWRASGRFGARFGGNDDAPVNFHFDAVADVGVSNISASDGRQFSSPVALGLGAELMLTITTR